MIWLGAGVLSLLILLFSLNRLANASRSDLGKALAVVLVVLLAIVGMILAITGRLFMGLPLLFSAFLGILKLGALARLLGARASWRARQHSSSGKRQGQDRVSTVRTAWLDMRLDHDSGALEGTVLQGRFKGRRLQSMSLQDLQDLFETLRMEDAESARLLEAYLDRDYGDDWRQGKGHDESATPPPRTGSMSAEEARDILGVDADADADTIRDAHKRLMKKLHPDHGGTSYLAARINEAKDVLLKS